MKKYIVLAIILIIFILLFIASMGVYFLKKDEIKAKMFSENTENIIVAEQEKTEPEVTVVKTLGTGSKRPADYTVESGYEAYSGASNGEVFIRKYGEEGLLLLVNNLKNENLKKEIKEFVSNSRTKLESEKAKLENYVENGNKIKNKVESKHGEVYDYYKISQERSLNTFEDNPEEIQMQYECINGYLSICLYLTYNYGDNLSNFEGSDIRNLGIYDVCCATYDLYTGKKLKFSDLFFEGEDYSAEIYELMQSEIGKQQLGQFTKREFTTLPQDYEYFTLNKIFFPKNNRYFSEGVIVSHDHYVTTIPAITIARDMKDVFIDHDKVEIAEFGRFDFRKVVVQEEILGVPFKVPKIKHVDDKIEEKINNNIEKYLNYLIENDYLEKYAKLKERLIDQTRSGKGNDIQLGMREGSISLAIFYNSHYEIFRMSLDPKTGEVMDFGPGMLLIWKMDENDRTKILEDLKKI